MIYSKDKHVIISFRTTKENAKSIEELARSGNQSTSDVIRGLINRELGRENRNHPTGDVRTMSGSA